MDIQHEDGYDELVDEIVDEVVQQFDVWQGAIDDMAKKGMLDLWDQGDLDQEIDEWIDRWMEEGRDDCFAYYDKFMAMWKNEFLPDYDKRMGKWILGCHESGWTGKEVFDELDVWFATK